MKKTCGVFMSVIFFISFGLIQTVSAAVENLAVEDEGEIVDFNPEEESLNFSKIMPTILYGDTSLPIKKVLLSYNIGSNSISTQESEEPNVIESEEEAFYDLKDNPGVTVRTVESALVNKNSDGVTVYSPGYAPTGLIYEVYSHTYYKYDSRSITEYNVGPRSGDKFIISVAKGAVEETTHDTTIKGNVTINGELSIPKALAKVIKAGLTGNAEGSVSYTYKAGKKYNGPPENKKANTRDYYTAYQKDLVTTSSKKYKVYDTYNGKVKTGTETYYKGIVKTKGVKMPKRVSYSKDFIN